MRIIKRISKNYLKNTKSSLPAVPLHHHSRLIMRRSHLSRDCRLSMMSCFNHHWWRCWISPNFKSALRYSLHGRFQPPMTAITGMNQSEALFGKVHLRTDNGTIISRAIRLAQLMNGLMWLDHKNDCANVWLGTHCRSHVASKKWPWKMQ